MADAAEELLSLSQKELDALPAEMREKIEAVRKQVLAARRLSTLKSAKDSLLDFVQMSMPDPRHPDDTNRSRYEVHQVHRFLAEKLEQVERGEILRLCISVQPRIGKSQLASKSFPAWLMGRDPYRQIILAGYGDEFVKEFGRDVRNLMLSPFYQQVFPGAELSRNAKAANRQQTTAGGILTFAGLGGQLTGKGADFLLIDDPIKNAEEARSKATKDKLWEGFIRDAMSRLMGKAGAVVITATRWAEDDIIGRLTDPDLGYTTAEDAAQWEVINIPALIETPQDKEDDPFDRDYGEVLWEERTPRAFLEQFRRLDPGGFAALYQGRPSPPEGNFFRRDDIVPHAYHHFSDLPPNLRYYAASDHAVSTQQNRDSTCAGIAGIDEKGDIWVLPDLIWAQLPADDQVEAMLRLMQEYKPLTWWAEKGHISQSIGPFLRKRMLEEQVYCTISEKTPVKDKQTRAQAIQARMSMGRVHLPAFAPWYSDALEQMLNFPNGAHDDFVDFISWLGIGLAQQVGAPKTVEPPNKEPPSGSLAWILKTSERIRKQNTAAEAHEHYLH